MSNKLCCWSRNKRTLRWVAAALLLGAVLVPGARAGDAPAWMHALVNQPLPEHDDKTDAVLLYSEHVVTVQSPDRIHTLVREAYKILRPDGRAYGTVQISYGIQEKITDLRGWCIPADGKDYEIKGKEAVDVMPLKVGGDLITDVHYRLLRIPAADPGNIVGYEYEIVEQPYVLQDIWRVQRSIPVREARYTLQLPSGWDYRANWLNAPQVTPSQAGNQWSWTLGNVKALRAEEYMPPVSGVSAQLVLSFYPPGGAPALSFGDWRQMGSWYAGLVEPQVQGSADLTAKVAALTADAATPVQKIQAIARFVQRDIRYVAIELGIGGWRPHSAPEVFTHRYGDCKDKVTLMKAMLREAGIDSYYLLINVTRGAVHPGSQAHLGAFNHAIVAIRLTGEIRDSGFHATLQHPALGQLLFFDPTRESIPLGEIGGYLQANYGLLVSPQGGELIALPKQQVGTTGVRRTGKLTLDARGTLAGDFDELLFGDRAAEQRDQWRSAAQFSDHIKPLESRLSHALGVYQLKKATVANAEQPQLPFEYQFSVRVPNYAKSAGKLLLVRPRVIGSKSASFLESKEKRAFPVELDSLIEDTDSFEITLPPGYEVEELPPPVELDFGFASYHSKSEFSGNTLRYRRQVQFRELSVPLSRVEDLKKLYRAIASDERNTAVFRPASEPEAAAK